MKKTQKNEYYGPNMNVHGYKQHTNRKKKCKTSLLRIYAKYSYTTNFIDIDVILACKVCNKDVSNIVAIKLHYIDKCISLLVLDVSRNGSRVIVSTIIVSS